MLPVGRRDHAEREQPDPEEHDPEQDPHERLRRARGDRRPRRAGTPRRPTSRRRRSRPARTARTTPSASPTPPSRARAGSRSRRTANSTPRAIPSVPRPTSWWPRPGNSRERISASRGATAGRSGSARITAANGVPQTAQTSSSIAFSSPQTGHGQNGARRSRGGLAGLPAGRSHGRRSAGSSSEREALSAPGRARRYQRAAVRASTFARRTHARRLTRAVGLRNDPQAAASRSQPARRSAIRGHVWSRSTRSRPAAPIRAGPRRIAAAARSRRRPPTATSAPSTRTPVSPSTQGLARAAGVPDDHRAPARGGLDEDVAPALDLEAGEPGPARHREDVAHGVVAGQVLLGNLAGEVDRALAAPRPPASGADPRRDRRRRSAGSRPARAARIDGIAADQHVLSLATDEPAHAHDEWSVADAQRRAKVVGRQVGAEPFDVGARIQHRDRHIPRDRRPHRPRDERRAQHRHARRARGRTPHQRVRARRDREPVLEAVGGGEVRQPAAASRGPSSASG